MRAKKILKSILPQKLITIIKKSPIIQEEIPPILFNTKGERVKIIYLSSEENRHTPYSLISGRLPRKILWDRYNYGLNTHFYVGGDIFNQKGSPQKKYGILLESEAIIPEIYHKIIKQECIIKKLDIFFTHSEYMLNKYPNAKFIPGSGVWFGTKRHGGEMKENVIKTKNISMVSSKKVICPMHIFRKKVALTFANELNVDVMGTVISNNYVNINDFLSNYRYSIIIENFISPYYFTEKIMNCFASKTVPIYIGATQIGKFFNIDGIIQINKNDITSIKEAIRQCSEKDYISRKAAINDNYHRVQHYLCIEDYICENYPEVITD
jgi:hypothetical protein